MSAKRTGLPILATLGIAVLTAASFAAEQQVLRGHPRLYFTAEDLPHLRALHNSGIHARIWANLAKSADWCAQQVPRTEWIPTRADDPEYENLYDRFYAAMHDTAIMEHVAFASALSDPEHDPYFDSARNWLLASAQVWKAEAGNPPDASKAYAVLRVLKGMAVSYDLLFDRLSEAERAEVREAIVAVGEPYYRFFQDPAMAGEGYNKHHGSVDAAPFGVAALAILGEVDQATGWLEVAVKKHTNYLLPNALTPSGTNDQSSNFWASTLQYRIFFCEPLRRVTGRDLFAEFRDALPGRIALAAIAAGQPADLEFNEDNRSVLFGPSYGQINYWSPVLIYLARRDRRPIYQQLALWDESLGALQHTRYITPQRKEELLFCLGPYAYLWCEESVQPAIEGKVPYSFLFPEPEVNEAYLRSSYQPGGIVAGMRKGAMVIHAGGRPVLVDQFGGSLVTSAALNSLPESATDLIVTDDGRSAKIHCLGPKSAGLSEQTVELDRPSRITVTRSMDRALTWWCAGDPVQNANVFTWPDGTKLTVTHGTIAEVNPHGYVETKRHFGGMQFADPHPFVYPTITAKPADGRLVLEIESPIAKGSNE